MVTVHIAFLVQFSSCWRQLLLISSLEEFGYAAHCVAHVVLCLLAPTVVDFTDGYGAHRVPAAILYLRKLTFDHFSYGYGAHRIPAVVL